MPLLKKEELLEDLSALLDDKLKRLETIQDIPEPNITYTPHSPSPSIEPKPVTINTPPAGNMRSRITDLVQQGYSDSEIASKLGISTTEVLIVKQMDLD